MSSSKEVDIDAFMDMADPDPDLHQQGDVPTVSLDQILEMLESAQGFTDEEREQLRADLLKSQGDFDTMQHMQQQQQQLFNSPLAVFAFAFIVIIFILG